MSEFLARHGAHVIVLGGPLLLLAGLFAMLELTRPDPGRRRPRPLIVLLALIWAAVATTHLTVIKEHVEESPVLGSFFLSLSLAQYSYAIAVLVRASTRLLAIGMAANSAVVLLWTYTRVVAIPFGLGDREPIGSIDLVATSLEVLTVVVTVIALRSREGAIARSPSLHTDEPDVIVRSAAHQKSSHP